MPSVSGKQHRFFGWAHSHPKESGVSSAVSQEFLSADKGRHFQKGGLVDIGQAAAVRSLGSRPHVLHGGGPAFMRKNHG
jgi:hypothetical protein